MELSFRNEHHEYAPRVLIDTHLAWINSHPNFKKEESKPFSYLEIMKETYQQAPWKEFYDRKHLHFCNGGPEYFVNSIFQMDRDKLAGMDFYSRLHNVFIKEDLKRYAAMEKGTDEDHWAFITIGFNEQTITPNQMLVLSKRVSDLKYFKSCKFVLEKHRENGIHHHTHFLVQFHKKEYRTKILQYIFQVKGLKNYVLAKHCIDILGPLNKSKIYQPFEKYDEYVQGIKQEGKQQYIEQDIRWRDENNFAHLYIKV